MKIPDSGLRQELRVRVPVDDREAESLREFGRWLDRLAEPFSQAAGPVHVTASAFVVGERGVVLHKHRRLGLWLQPGGHIEPGESPAEAAEREAREETGLDVSHAFGRPLLVHTDVHDGGRGHTHLDLRYLFVASGEPDPPPGESEHVAWFDLRTALEVADPGLVGGLGALVRGPLEIRRAAADDAVAVAAIYLRSFKQGVAGVELAHRDDEVREWIRTVVVATRETWIAWRAGVPVGFVVLNDSWVDHLYVDVPWWGTGVGSELVRFAQGRVAGGLQLWTFQSNARARSFYAHHGFVEVEWTDGADNEERAPDVRSEWRR